MKRFFAFVLLVVMLLLVVLSGCTPRPASNERIKRDLEDWTGRDFQRIDITKRQTDTNSRIDTIYVDAYCEDVSYPYEYTMEYVLYNEGWILDGVKKNFILG